MQLEFMKMKDAHENPSEELQSMIKELQHHFKPYYKITHSPFFLPYISYRSSEEKLLKINIKKNNRVKLVIGYHSSILTSLKHPQFELKMHTPNKCDDPQFYNIE